MGLFIAACISTPSHYTVKEMGKKRRKVFVGLSGGVDSSVSAALLQKAGYDVTGVFIKVWQADFLPCTWREERREAMRAAAHLDMPFLTLDLEKEYKKDVVDYMIREYGAGRVPNPDVMCNKYVKFGAFLKFAQKAGADFIATGHYARVVISHQSLATSKYQLLKGVDAEKDQSYFLWTLTQEQLSHTLFPVGHLHKSEVRALARKFGLGNANKKDSQGLCFMGRVDMVEFLQHYLKTQKGNVLDVHGTVIGAHEGAFLYTIGQRHGFFVQKSSPSEEPFFVIAKDIEKNTITVSHRDAQRVTGKGTSAMLSEVNMLGEKLQATTVQQCVVRIRHRGELKEATWENLNSLNQGEARVTFNTPQEGIAPGQSLVAYDNEECLGGGIVHAVP